MAAIDVLVVGGSGRVGGSTLRWLDQLGSSSGSSAPALKLASGGRSRSRFQASQQRLNLPDLGFVEIDLDHSVEVLTAAVRGANLVVHTAGPSQGRTQPKLLQACIAAGVPYCDVCDEWPLSQHAKALAASAAAAGVPAVVSCGIWPGVSALMAAEAVDRLGGLREEYGHGAHARIKHWHCGAASRRRRDAFGPRFAAAAVFGSAHRNYRVCYRVCDPRRGV